MSTSHGPHVSPAPGAGVAFPKRWGFARHSLESLPGPPGPARLQNAPPKIRPECVQVPSSKGYGARRYTPTPAPPESKGRKINEESALKTKAYTGGGGARGGPSSVFQKAIAKRRCGFGRHWCLVYGKRQTPTLTLVSIARPACRPQRAPQFGDSCQNLFRLLFRSNRGARIINPGGIIGTPAGRPDFQPPFKK